MDDVTLRHNEKMKRIKAARDRMMETKTEEKGLIIVHTGAGKGKSSSGFGMVMRCIAWGMPCAVVQFIKGNWDTGEKTLLRDRFSEECRFFVSGEGFTWETQDRERDRQLVQSAWERSCAYLADGERKLVVLDEINVALKLGYLEPERVLEGLALRPPLTHVALTGRGAPPALLERADLVTEMKVVRHPFREQGVKAQAGIEY
jgi:cob(I)alamin adenosyltransferase